MGTMIELKAADGHALQAYLAEPAMRPRGGIVVVQEIFGVNSHIRSVADGYAADGYLAIAPALFDRVHRGYESGYTQPEIQAGVALMQKVAWDDAIRDVSAAVEAVKHAGETGIVGFCWGGAVAWLAAARVPGLAAAVPYYGGAIPSLAERTTELPHDAALRREGRLTACREGARRRRRPSGREGAFLRGRPRLQLRPARLVR